jgi:hypothetical protein
MEALIRYPIVSWIPLLYSSCLDDEVAKELESVTKHMEEKSEEEYADYGEEEDNERDEF